MLQKIILLVLSLSFLAFGQNEFNSNELYDQYKKRSGGS